MAVDADSVSLRTQGNMAGSKNSDIVGSSSLTSELFQELFQLLQACNGTSPILASTNKSSVVHSDCLIALRTFANFQDSLHIVLGTSGLSCRAGRVTLRGSSTDSNKSEILQIRCDTLPILIVFSPSEYD